MLTVVKLSEDSVVLAALNTDRPGLSASQETDSVSKGISPSAY